MSRVRITYEELVEAFDRWNEVYPRNTVAMFDRYLCSEGGFPSLYNLAQDAWMMDEEVARRIQLLLSPHYITIIKAIAIRNGEVSQDED